MIDKQKYLNRYLKCFGDEEHSFTKEFPERCEVCGEIQSDFIIATLFQENEKLKAELWALENSHKTAIRFNEENKILRDAIEHVCKNAGKEFGWLNLLDEALEKVSK